MSVDLRQTSFNDYEYIQKTILNLLNFFGYMTYSEIIDFFPTFDESKIKKSLTNLRRIRYIKCLYFNHIRYYATQISNRNGIGYERHNNLREVNRFIRYLLNATNDKGVLLNSIKFIEQEIYPFDVIIACNNTCYSIMYCQHDSIALYSQLINEQDRILDTKEIEFKNRRAENSNYCIMDIPMRIIIVENTDDMNLIHLRKVKYIVCRQGTNYLIKEGTK